MEQVIPFIMLFFISFLLYNEYIFLVFMIFISLIVFIVSDIEHRIYILKHRYSYLPTKDIP